MGRPKKISTENEKKPVKRRKEPSIALELELTNQPPIEKPDSKDESIGISPKKETEKREVLKKESASEKPKFTLDKPVFLQVNSGNIFQIFGSGIIAPSKYARRTFNDVQSQSSETLVLSNGLFGELNDTQVLIELNIFDNDKQYINISDTIAFLSIPLPISRIKRICVANKGIKDELLKTALVNDGGIISETMIVPEFPVSLRSLQVEEVISKQETDYTNKLLHYNKILGSFAYLKNYSLLQANKTNKISTLPEHYIYAVQAISNLSPFKLFSNERVLSFYKKLFGIEQAENPLLRWILDRINIQENFTDEDVKDFASSLNTNTASLAFLYAAKPILTDLLKSIERKSAIRKISSIVDPEKFYLLIFAFLRTYGNVNTEEKSILRLDIKDMDVNGSGEYIFSILGYFYGYSTQRNFDEKIQLNDTIFSNFFENLNRPSIKFDLKTLFDFVTIEAVYSFVFHNKKLNDTDTSMLTSSSIKAEWLKKPSNLPANYKFTADPPLYGKTFYKLTRRSELEELLEKIWQIKSEIPALSVFGNICLRHGIKIQFMTLDDFAQNGNIRFYMYFKKSDVIDALKISKLPMSEALASLNESIKFQEFE